MHSVAITSPSQPSRSAACFGIVEQHSHDAHQNHDVYSSVACVQGGKLQIGAPHGNWQMVVVYRGKHDPVRPIASIASSMYLHRWSRYCRHGSRYVVAVGELTAESSAYYRTPSLPAACDDARQLGSSTDPTLLFGITYVTWSVAG